MFVCLFVCLSVSFFIWPEGALVHLTTKAFALLPTVASVFFRPTADFAAFASFPRTKAFGPSRRSCVCACVCVCLFGSCAYPPFLCAAADARVVLQEHRRPRRGTYPRVPLDYSRVPLEYSRVPLRNSTRASAPTQRRVGLRAAVSTALRATEESRVPSSTLGSPRVRGMLMCAFLRFGRSVRNRS